MYRKSLAAAMLALSSAPVACSGEIRDGEVPAPAGEAPARNGGSGGMAASGAPKSPVSPPSAPACATAANPGRTWLRRLTRFEYNNTVRDLLGIDTSPASAFPAEGKALGFDTNADILVTTPQHVESYITAAESLADAAVKNLAQLAPACSAQGADEACAADFISSFGKRAYRRPLTDAEKARLLAAYRAGRQPSDHTDGMRHVVSAILASAPFLYRVEQGVGSGAVRRVSSFEMASRLSYFLWGTMPDDKLFAAADSGALETPGEIAKHAARMIDDPRARTMFEHFHRQWLQFESMEGLEKKSSDFPMWKDGVAQSLFEGSGRVFEHLAWRPGATLTHFLTEPVLAVNTTLAPIYGGAGGDQLSVVRMDGQRSGVLTDPGLLATHAGGGSDEVVTPMMRGKWIQTQLLCHPLPPPPPDVPEPPPVDAKASMRERLRQHRDVAACAACHALIDPIGLAMETFDAIGRHRTTDRGLPIDTTGELALDGQMVTFANVQELGQRLSKSDTAQQCVTTQWLRFALGRVEGASDQCAIDTILARARAKGFELREVVLALTESVPFQFIAAGGGQ